MINAVLNKLMWKVGPIGKSKKSKMEAGIQKESAIPEEILLIPNSELNKTRSMVTKAKLINTY